MFATVINGLAKNTKQNIAMLDEIAEFRAIKAEINKARCVIEFNASGNITSVNENILKALGYYEADLLNEHHQILVERAESIAPAYNVFWHGLNEGRTQAGVFKLVNKKGEVVWFQGYYAPITGSTGALRKVVSYLTDITADRNKSIKLQGEDEALNQSFGVLECGLTGLMMDCNELFEKQLGYSRGELLGNPVSMFLPPEIAKSPDYKAMWEKLAKGEVQIRQIKRISKSGDELWFQSNYVPVHDDAGVVNRVIVYSVCITAEKRKNAEYEAQIAAVDRVQGVISFDLKGNVLTLNENFCKAVGYTQAEVVGKHHSVFVSDEEKNSSEYQQFWRDLANGHAVADTFHRFGKGGKEIWLQASYNPIIDADGKVVKIIKYATDITAQKQLDADNAGQLLSIDRALGVIQFSLDGKVTQVNRNFADLIEYSENEILGKHHSLLVDAEYRNSPDYKEFWAQLNRGEFVAGTFKHIAKSGKVIWLQASYNPIMDSNGKPFKVVKFATDITEQHNAAAALENAVDETQHVIENAKTGDLSSRVSLEGKAGAIASLCDGVNALMDKMTEVIIQVREAGETINTAAGEISSGNNDLSSRTEQQASSLEETASSMEELASTVKQNAENAKQANQLAAAASGVAVKGGEVVGQVVSTMSAINSSAKKIEDIISVIDGIAFQTNILALNAAVEAARAGEQGRGFAVVAGEVRNLAQRSASAAKEIKELITDSVNKTAEGTKQVENAGQTMQEIVTSVQRVTDIMGEITAASAEQSAGIDQVNNAITSMDEVTQQNAALVEEAAAAAESLVDQAVGLMDTVSAFKLSGGSAYASSPTQRTKATVAKLAPRPSAKPVAKASAAKMRVTTNNDDGDWEEF